MSRENMLRQAVLVAGLVRTVEAAELGLDATLEFPVTLQVVLVLVGLAADGADVRGPAVVVVVVLVCNKRGTT